MCELPSLPFSLELMSWRWLYQIPLQCFYKTKKLIEIPKKGLTFEVLKLRVEKTFGVSDLIMKYRTSSSSKVQEINNTADIVSAIEDGVTTIYVHKPGELNEFEPASSSRASTLRMSHMPDAQKIVQILQAAETGNLEQLQQLMQPKQKQEGDSNSNNFPPPFAWINCCDSEGKTPLHLAAINDHVTVVQWLVEQGADVNYCDKSGWSPLHSAACSKNEKIINILLAHKDIKGNDDTKMLSHVIKLTHFFEQLTCELWEMTTLRCTCLLRTHPLPSAISIKSLKHSKR